MEIAIHVGKTAEELADIFAKQLKIWVDETAANRFHIALSGGSTPSLLFSHLSSHYKDKINWEKIHFWWGDERMVPGDDPQSNYGVANQLLLSKLTLSPDHIHPIRGGALSLEETRRYGKEIEEWLSEENGWPRFDLVMLGLGDDGHTASIFPNQIKLMESETITALAIHPVTGQQRITLTGKVLNHAKRVAFLVSGKSKSIIFNELISHSKNSMNYPASKISPSGELHWFVDQTCKNGVHP